jgi:hypothetical protein
MNGKFESNSNDYDESNLNRLHSVPGAGVVAGDAIARPSLVRAALGSPLSLRDEFRCQLIKFDQRLVADRAVHDFAPLLPL